MKREDWDKIVERGPVVPPSFEPAHSAQTIYWIGEIDGEPHKEYLGEMPNTYYDKRYVDWYYYSFTALEPDPDSIGVWLYRRTDEDEGVFEIDDWYAEEIECAHLWMTEKDFLNEWGYQKDRDKEVYL